MCSRGKSKNHASGQLLRESFVRNGKTYTLDFAYDLSGKPYFLLATVDGAMSLYYFVTNLQGDVVRITNAQKETLANYSYDAYGKLLSVTNAAGAAISDTSNIALINPLRYRGYYYDSETELYYLQSRYYDPTTCRFINADSYASTGQDFLGYNMFAYCLNNPLRYTDYDGELAYPGEIHQAVVQRIAKEYGYFPEQTIYYSAPFKGRKRGRVDLISKDGEIWEVKPMGTFYYQQGLVQINQYTRSDNTWKKPPKNANISKPLKLKKGGPIPSERFTYHGRDGDYLVIYKYAGEGIIQYAYVKVPEPEEVLAYAGVCALGAVAIGAYKAFSPAPLFRKCYLTDYYCEMQKAFS